MVVLYTVGLCSLRERGMALCMHAMSVSPSSVAARTQWAASGLETPRVSSSDAHQRSPQPSSGSPRVAAARPHGTAGAAARGTDRSGGVGVDGSSGGGHGGNGGGHGLSSTSSVTIKDRTRPGVR